MTVAFRAYATFLVVVHNALPPAADEWNQVIAVYRDHPNVASLRVLVYTDGGSPNVAQRSDLTAAITNRNMLTAVVSSSVLARAAGIAISWLVPNLRMFNPTELESALDYLGATGGDRRILREIVDQLRRDLSPASARTPLR
jgi:hypothetical protein